MRVTEHNVHMTLGLPKGPLELCYLDRVIFKLTSMPGQFPSLRGWTNNKIKSKVGQQFEIEFDRGYLEGSLDKTTVTDEEEDVNKEELCNKSVQGKAKVNDQTRVSNIKGALFRDGKMATNLIITNNPLLAEVTTELEELLPSARAPLKMVRKVAMESISDALIGDMPKKSKSRAPIDAIAKHFVCSRDTVRNFSQFTPPNFSLGISQGKKQALPKGVILVD
ncbi:hypothetical protein Cgig2_007457 [Carnegiea gigantea]|uniref:Uncharacterized protein n=1 Tax=Carnegiea gigantea TaxID=171969 RepID=A0A9Q1GRW9_9CARY|nr:hypothetical protein Cgig2_007457 [Carnegiea gigantea]